MNCQSGRKKLLDYHQGKLSFAEYKKVNEHIQTCDSCAEKLEALIEKKDYQESEHKYNHQHQGNRVGLPTPASIQKARKRNLKIAIFASVIVMSVVVLIVSSKVDLLEKVGIGDKAAFGEKVAVSSENNNIEFTVSHVAADKERTILYFEINDLNSSEPIFIDHDGIDVLEKDIWAGPGYRGGGAFITSDVKEGVSKGRFFLPELISKENTITLQIAEFFRLKDPDIEPNSNEWLDVENRVVVSGEWQVEVPVQKHLAETFELSKTVEVNDAEVKIKKLVLSPTISILEYTYKRDSSNDHNREIILSHLEADGERYETQQVLGNSIDKGIHQQTIIFDSIYFQQPKEITVHLGKMVQRVANQEKINFDPANLPFTFTYLNEPITIEKVDVADPTGSVNSGGPTHVVIKEEYRENRIYQKLNINFDYFRFNSNARGMHEIHTASEGIWVNREGNTLNELSKESEPNSYRFFTTEHHVEISPDKDGNQFIPDFLFIDGYTKETLLDEKMTIRLVSDSTNREN